MIKALFLQLTLLAAALLCMPACASAHTDNADILGKWKISRWIGSADVSALSDRQVRSLIGKPVIVRKDKFEFNGQACEKPGYRRNIIGDAQQFRNEWRADSAALGLAEPVVSVETGCNVIFPKSKDKIIIELDGNFLEAARWEK